MDSPKIADFEKTRKILLRTIDHFIKKREKKILMIKFAFIFIITGTTFVLVAILTKRVPNPVVYSENKNIVSIPLYPGYVAKSGGKIYWFSTKPTFDYNQMQWLGDSPIEITSCIADPWPYGTGGSSFLIKTDYE